MAKELHIFITAEELFHVGGITITNTMFTSYLVTVLLIAFLLYSRTKIKNTDRPTGLQNVLEFAVQGAIDLVEGIAGKTKRAAAFLPLIFSFFVFIWLNNWFELLPGVHTIYVTGKPGIELANVPSFLQASPVFAANAEVMKAEDHSTAAESEMPASPDGDHSEETAAAAGSHSEEKKHEVSLLRGAHADINMTIAIALVSVGATQYFGLKFAHFGYLKKFFNFSSPVNFFIGILELILEASKVMSFGFRLFGNIFAGEVLLSVIKFLVPILLPIPFIGLELFVGGLQAYVFTMLSLVFFNMAASESHH